MWKAIQDSSYFLLLTKDNGYEIYITEFINIWNVYFTEAAFLLCLKESNDIVMLDDEKEYTQKGLKLLSNPGDLKEYKIEKEENGQKLFVSLTMKFGYSFMFECRLTKGSEEMFFHKVTRPLLKAVNDLRSSQNELRQLLKRKDKEIDEYKEEGGEIVYRHLKTAWYDDETHMNKHQLYECTFGESNIPHCVIERHVVLPQRNIVKVEPGTSHLIASQPVIVKSEIKQEPESQPLEEFSIPHVPMGCKQEVIKTKPDTSPSKRSKIIKLNF